MIKNKSIIFSTVTRNPGRKFIQSINQFIKIAKNFKNYKIIIIESDSSFDTRELFSNFKDSNIIIKRMGCLKKSLSNGHLRTERIAFSRNQYLKLIFKSKRLSDYDYLIVFDSDGVSDKINYKSIVDALSIKQKWDAQFSNQTLAYYDIYALRCEGWVEYDCILKLNELIKKNNNPRQAFKDSISSKMIKINRKSPLIKVQSAFGGLGLYKIKSIGKAKYIGSIDNIPICEHVTFHKELSKSNSLLYINPGLISSFGMNEHVFKNKILTRLPSSIFNFFYKLR
tara:strand:+ start:753 stop:1601 length:849 start_codon:yes stop_codon:yes gene_type:complete